MSEKNNYWQVLMVKIAETSMSQLTSFNSCYKKNSEIIIIQLNNKILDGSETLELCIMCDFNNAQVLYIEYTLYNGN